MDVEDTMIKKYLKMKEAKQQKKKAPAFTKEQIFEYLDNTENEGLELLHKLYVLLSYFAALRNSEADAMKFSDITATEDGLEIHIIRTKTDKAHVGEDKFIPKDQNER